MIYLLRIGIFFLLSVLLWHPICLPQEKSLEFYENLQGKLWPDGRPVKLLSELITKDTKTKRGKATTDKISEVLAPLEFDGAVNGEVNSIFLTGTEIYIGGEFSSVSGQSVGGFAKWNGESWVPSGNGTNGKVNSVHVKGTQIVLGGLFTKAFGKTANNIIKWNGLNWESPTTGLDKQVLAVAATESKIYLGGEFTVADGLGADHIAVWTSTGLSGAGLGVNGTVRTIFIDGTDVYFGGDFTHSVAGNIEINHVAKWDGNKFSPLGSGVNGPVYSISVSKGEVFVGGSFNSAGGSAASNIAKWDGNKWIALGSEIKGRINSISVAGKLVYIGGSLFKKDDSSVTNLAMWDGTDWKSIGSGTNENSEVFSLKKAGSILYIGGNFELFNGESKPNLARYYLPKPDKIQLVAPADNVKNLDSQVTFKWNEEDLSNYYRFQISTSSDFSNLIFEDTIRTPTLSVSNLKSKREYYYWRVRGENESGNGLWSDKRAFSVKLTTVDLAFPIDAGTVTMNGTTFQWGMALNADYYQLQISRSPLFSSFLFNDSTLNETTKFVGWPLIFKPDSFYFWRVRAFNPVASSDWSLVQSFKSDLPARNVSLYNDSLIVKLPSYINFMFHAVDQNNLGVHDLIESEFTALEDGKSISPTESRLQIGKADQLAYNLRSILMLDNSSSISPSDLSKIKTAAISFVRKMALGQQTALYVFSENTQLIQDFTTDSTILISAIKSISGGFNSTNLYGAVIQGTSRWTDHYSLSTVNQGVMILLTDGDDTQGSSNLEQALVKRGDKRIITVGLGNEINMPVLQSLGNAGFFHVTNIDLLNQKFLDIQTDLISFTNSFYWLNYQSPKRGNNNHVLRLKLEKNHNTGERSFIESQFNSNGFYSVFPGIVVNSSPQKPEGEDVVSLPGNVTATVVIETPFMFNSIPYQFHISNPSLLAISNSIIESEYLFKASASAGESVNVGISDESNGLFKNLTVNFTESSSVDDSGIPLNFMLHPAVPNPFNPTTSIQIDVPEIALITLKVFDVLGREVEIILRSRKEPGSYIITWNASAFSSGVYYYSLIAESPRGILFFKTGKMTLIK